MSAWSEVPIVNIDPDMATITVTLSAFGSGVLAVLSSIGATFSRDAGGKMLEMD